MHPLAILGLAYGVGLLLAPVPAGLIGLVVVSIALGLLRLRVPAGRWRLGPVLPAWLYVSIGLVALTAALSLPARSPRPGPADISRWAMADPVTVVSGPATVAKKSGQDLPKTSPKDLAKNAAKKPAPSLAIVRGQMVSKVRLTRSNRGQFWLEATQLSTVNLSPAPEPSGNPAPPDPLDAARPVTGKLYVTVPLLQATGFQPGQWLTVTGRLFQPAAATNPGQFDFRDYLARQNCFAVLAGQQLEALAEPGTATLASLGAESWLSQIRSRLVKQWITTLGYPEGVIVGSIVLGNQAAEAPAEWRDRFVQVGLAHVLAASGFHVSVLLGVLAALTRGWRRSLAVLAGAIALMVFVALAGGSPAVLRAALMGVAALIGWASGRSINGLGALSLAVTALLLWQPLWIWDVGFQLSATATFGLLVSAEPIARKLDFLPPIIAESLATTLAATLWTLPIQLFTFYEISPYAVVANLGSSFLVSLITVAGMASAVISAILPVVGGAIAWLFLFYPTRLLLWLVETIAAWPGSRLATGAITVLQVLCLYGLFLWVWRGRWWQTKGRWWLAAALTLSFILVPAVTKQMNALTVTVLDAGDRPLWVARDRSQVWFAAALETGQVRGLAIPFLRQDGTQTLTRAIVLASPNQPSASPASDPNSPNPNSPALDNRTSEPWDLLWQTTAIATLQDARPGQGDRRLAALAQRHQGQYQAGPTNIREGRLGLDLSRGLARFNVDDRPWLWLGNLTSREQVAWLAAQDQAPIAPQADPAQPPDPQPLPPVAVLWWSGQAIDPKLLDALQPQAALASADAIDPSAVALLSDRRIPLYWTGRDGAIEWSRDRGFVTRQTDQPTRQPWAL